MAVLPECKAPEIPAVSMTPTKRRRRRRRATSRTSDSSDISVSSNNTSGNTSSTSIDTDTALRNRKRRQRCKKNKNKAQRQQPILDVPLSLEEQAKYVALDCEMVGVGWNGARSIVARVTIIDWNGETILDEFIQPTEPVTNYRTFVSGVTADDLDNAVMNLEECRQFILNLLDDKILVGHALRNDLKALGISHPWYMTRDTAKYEPFMQVRFSDGILWPRKLKDLAKNKLNRNIQEFGKPHTSYEDALAAMDLYRTVRRKWEKAIEYKIKRTNEIHKKKELLERDLCDSTSSLSSSSEDYLSSTSL